MSRIFICIIILLISCNKDNRTQNFNELEKNNESSDNPIYIIPNKIMYVNSKKGLQVRSMPNINSERIGLLDYLSEVNIIREDHNVININNIEGKWVYINRPIEGWIFNGYLSLEPLYLEQQLLRMDVELTVKDNMDYIISFFEDYFNFKELRSAKNIEEFLIIFGITDDNRNITNQVFEAPMLWGGVTINEHIIEYGPYRLIVYNESLLMSLEIEINEDNFIDLFPHKTLDEYLADGNFGNNVWEREDGFKFLYRNEYEGWYLMFKNNILYKISFYQYVT
jgi:hypothetical protein